MSRTLEEIRKKIDSIDNQVHDLLMERAALVFDIAAEKARNKMQVVQPAREAMMLRRLLGRHEGPLPEATVVHIWRELVGAVSLLQTGLNVVVAAKDDNTLYWDMARNYFGSVLPMKKANGALAAVGAVRENSASFAVVPWPDDADDNPWWSQIMNQSEPMRIVCCLPYGSEHENMQGRPRALVVSKIDFKDSGDDRSFLGLELTHDVSRGKIVDVLKKLDLEVLSLHSNLAKTGNNQHLVEVKKFIDVDDEMLRKIHEAFETNAVRCMSLGGYPVPPVFKKMIYGASAAPQAEPKTATNK